MRKIIVIAAMIIAASFSTSCAQDFKKVGKTYKVEKTVKASSERETGFTWEDSKGKSYPIYMGQTGSCYIKKVSKKSGKEYKQYLGKEVSQDICNQLGIHYKPKK